MKKYLLDTNLLLRFLLADHTTLSQKAEHLFQRAANRECLLILTALGLAEAVWVLSSYYKLQRKQIADNLAKLIVRVGVQCPEQSIILDALQRFTATNCDFYDCYLAASAVASGTSIASFDKDFAKFADVTLWDAQREQ
jgi:predicted nucleic-acid-binding protein